MIKSLVGRKSCALFLLMLACLFVSASGWAADSVVSLPGVQVRLGGAGAGSTGEVSSAIKIILGLTILSLAPAILMSMTAFIRIVIVLSMLRHALGMQETPPNTVIISLSLFLTLFTMSATLQEVNTKAFQPFMDGKITIMDSAQARP